MTNHKSVTQTGVTDIVTHRSNQNSQNVLRSEHLSCSSCSRTESFCRIVLRATPWCRLRCHVSKVRPGRGNADVDEERICRLDDINGVNIIMVRVWSVIYRSDGV